MSLNERDQIILIIVCSIVGFVVILLIISFIFWFLIRYYRSKTKCLNKNVRKSSSFSSRYHHSIPYIVQKKGSTRKKRRRYNTSDSATTFEYDPPHLINQNVKNLEKILNREPTLRTKSWTFEDGPLNHCYYTNSSNEPVYTSSSTILTSLSNLPTQPQQTNFSNQLDNLLRLKQIQNIKHPVKYSPNFHPINQPLTTDYYRSMSPLPSTTPTNSSYHNSLEPIYIQTNKNLNPTSIHKARSRELEDDTAILY